MDEDPVPKPAEKAEGGTSMGNPFKSTKKGAFHTFLGPPTAKAQRAAMRSLNAMMSTHASVLQDSVGPPSAEVCRTVASFP
jgi:hypothetical protein